MIDAVTFPQVPEAVRIVCLALGVPEAVFAQDLRLLEAAGHIAPDQPAVQTLHRLFVDVAERLNLAIPTEQAAIALIHDHPETTIGHLIAALEQELAAEAGAGSEPEPTEPEPTEPNGGQTADGQPVHGE